MTRPQALIVDDEPDIRELLELTLARMDVDSQQAASLEKAYEKLAAAKYQLCLADMRLPDGDGLELVEWMQSHAAGVPVAVITAHGNVETAVQALKLGAFDFISKPFQEVEVLARVRTHLALRKMTLRSTPSPTFVRWD